MDIGQLSVSSIEYKVLETIFKHNYTPHKNDTIFTCPSIIEAIRFYGEKKRSEGFVEGFDRAKETDDS